MFYYNIYFTLLAITWILWIHNKHLETPLLNNQILLKICPVIKCYKSTSQNQRGRFWTHVFWALYFLRYLRGQKSLSQWIPLKKWREEIPIITNYMIKFSCCLGDWRGRNSPKRTLPKNSLKYRFINRSKFDILHTTTSIDFFFQKREGKRDKRK